MVGLVTHILPRSQPRRHSGRSEAHTATKSMLTSTLGRLCNVQVAEFRSLRYKHAVSSFSCLTFFLTQNIDFKLNMTPLIIASLSLHIALIVAFPTQAVRDAELISQQSSVTSDRVPTGWSRQDIFILISVCVALIGIFVGVLVASTTVRNFFYKPLHCKFTLSQNALCLS